MADDPWAEFKPKPAADPWAEFNPKGTVEPQESATGSFFAGATQGASAGLADPLEAIRSAGYGGKDAPLSTITGLGRLGYEKLAGSGEATQAYEKTLAELQRQNLQARQQHPWAYGAGQLAGGTAVMAPFPAGGASLAGRMGTGAALGGTYGAVEGAAEAQPGERVRGALTGGALGAAGGAVGGAIPLPRLKKAEVELVPEASELRNAATEAYEQLKSANVKLPAEAAIDLQQGLVGKLNGQAYFKEDQPRTFRAIERLTSGSGSTEAGTSSNEIYAMRTALNHILKDEHLHPSDASAARIAIEDIDNFLAKVPGFADTAQKARANWRAYKMSTELGTQEERARLGAASSGVGANLPNALRQRIKSLYFDKKVHKTPEETELMRQIVVGSPVTNIARLISRLGPHHPLHGWVPALLFDLKGGAGMGVLSLAAGALAKHVEERTTLGRIEKLDELIRGGGKSAPVQSRRSFPGAAAAGAAGGATAGANLYGNQ